MRWSWLSLAVVLLAAATAAAEEAKTPAVEIGGQVSGFVPVYFPDGPVVLVGAGPRVGLNVSQRLALHFYADAVTPVENSGLNGLYAFELKTPLRRSSGGQRTLSLTVGLCAPFQYTHVAERRTARPDGSVVVYEGFRRFRVDSPTTLIVGIARDHAFSRHASSNFALQALVGPIGGIALRASIGLSFGAGGYR